jgi:hypothetical protein
MMKSNKLERRVLEVLLSNGHPMLSLLRQQAENAEVISRELTGHGFFAQFRVPTELRLAGNPSFQLTDVIGSAQNVKNGVGFVLFVKSGVLSMLEGFTYNEPWPDHLQELKLEYSNKDRDFSGLPPLPPPN